MPETAPRCPSRILDPFICANDWKAVRFLRPFTFLPPSLPPGSVVSNLLVHRLMGPIEYRMNVLGSNGRAIELDQYLVEGRARACPGSTGYWATASSRY